METDARQLFQELFTQITIEETRGEKEAILFWIMKKVLGLSRTDVLSGKKISYEKGELTEILNRVNSHEPVQYILNEAEFYGRVFTVNPAVLIPRPETEILVSEVIGFSAASTQPVLDIGTGSGCIAISVALAIPETKVLATDISREALKVAKKNAALLKAQVQFLNHDILKQDIPAGPYQVIASNPPYVPQGRKDTLQKRVSQYEPAGALFVPDERQLLFYETISAKSVKHLSPGGMLILEIDETLGKEVAALLAKDGYSNIRILQDLGGKDRHVSGIRT